MKSNHRRTHSQDFLAQQPQFSFKMVDNDPNSNHEIS